MCRFGGNVNKLCKEDDCKECYEKSFASHEKAQFWDYEKNGDLKPRDVFKSSGKKYWLNCQQCFHSLHIALNHVVGGRWCPYCSKPPQKLCNDNHCNLCHEKSFASNEQSQFWDDAKNGDVKPRDIIKGSHTKYWLKCHLCSHSFYSTINNIVRGSWCPYCANNKLCDNHHCNLCYEKSFASHEKAHFWDDIANGDVKPRDVFKNSQTKYFFKCEKCCHLFDTTPGNVVSGGNWCSYCANKRLCAAHHCNSCHHKSFISHEKAQFWDDSKNGGVKPRDIFKSSNKKYIFTCNECFHSFDVSLGDVVGGSWCPYCASNKLCDDYDCTSCYKKSFASSEKAQFWDYTKNGDTKPRNVFKNSVKKYHFQCDVCSNSFPASLDHVVRGRWCPMCKNKTEKLVFQTLKQKYPDIIHQAKFDWCKNVKHLPFDMLIPSKKVIIELDGCQHFQQISNWQSCDVTQEKDVIKMKKALENGYRIIRIVQKDILNKYFNWYDTLVEKIENANDALVFISMDDDKYNNHKTILCG
jgi:very-short-patch-repair endonuclease